MPIHVRRAAVDEPPSPEVLGLVAPVIHAARGLGGADPLLSLRIDPVGDRFLVTLAVRPDGLFLATRAEEIGADPLVALARCADALASRMASFPAEASACNRPLAVSEFLLDSWLLPLEAIDGFGTPDLERLADQRFLYHLPDDEALLRARLGGDPFLAYAVKGSRELRAFVRDGGDWVRVDDVERIGWRLGEARDTPFEVPATRFQPDGTSSQVTLRVTARHLPRCRTLGEAVTALSGAPAVFAHVASLDRLLLIMADGPDLVRLFSYAFHNSGVSRDAGPLGMPAWAAPRFPTPRKERLRDVLACPECHGPLQHPDAGGPFCPRCATSYHEAEGCVSFLGPCHQAVDDPQASRNTCSKQLIHDLRLFADGLVLNAGAGDTPVVADNLVNLEIVRYPNVDVVADGQRLPFRDDAFDMVFSQSVAEHVPDPFAYARELMRVLKPGGVLYVDAPFIAAFHGYPDHYFNPTVQGMRRLFPEAEEIDLHEGPHHAPSQAAFEILLRFARLIRTDAARQAFLRLPIGEFLDQVRTGQNPFVTRDLDPLRSFEIAAGCGLYARKPLPLA